MTVCTVLHCTKSSNGRFQYTKGLLTEYAVCDDHRLQLEAGEPWLYDQDRHALLLGDDMPAAAVKFSVTRSISPGAVVTYQTIRDEEPRSMYLSPELLDKMGIMFGR